MKYNPVPHDVRNLENHAKALEEAAATLRLVIAAMKDEGFERLAVANSVQIEKAKKDARNFGNAAWHALDEARKDRDRLPVDGQKPAAKAAKKPQKAKAKAVSE